MCLDIQFNTKDEVTRLSEEACKSGETLYVHSYDDVVIVDARSLLALFALVGKPCRLVGEDSCNPKVLERVARRAGVTV